MIIGVDSLSNALSKIDGVDSRRFHKGKYTGVRGIAGTTSYHPSNLG